jgi:hypothetical protein
MDLIDFLFPKSRPRPPRHVRAIHHTHHHRHHHHRSNTVSTATITWALPTARTDGTPLSPSELASFAIFDSASPGAAIGTVPGSATTFTTGVLTVGEHDFTVTCTDTTGHVSAASSPPAVVTVPATLASPNPPSSVTAVLNS